MYNQMKHTSLAVLFVCFCNFCAHSQNKEANFDEFAAVFPELDLPVNTSPFNSNPTYTSLSKQRPLNTISCARFFFNGDKRQLSYVFESFDMEDENESSIKTFEYKFFPAFRVVTRKIVLLGYLRIGVNSTEYYVAFFNTTSKKLIAIIRTNKIVDDFEVELIERSIISSDLTLHHYKYSMLNHDVHRKADSTRLKTIIVHSAYRSFKENQKISIVGVDTVKTKCAVSDFQSRNAKCLRFDPMQKLVESLK